MDERQLTATLFAALREYHTPTVEHCQRVGLAARHLADAAGFSPGLTVAVGLAGDLHDVGKLGVSTALLDSPDPLDEADRVTIESHPTVGALLVVQFGRTLSTVIASGIRHHHERWDGAGYPSRLRGREIPIGARILAIVDTFDAMTKLRVYHRRVSEEQAIEEIAACAGTQFDPYLVDVFKDLNT